MFNYKSGIPIAINDLNDKTLYISTDDNKRRMRKDFKEGKIKNKGEQYIEIEKGNFIPLCDFDERDVIYICGPSGVGKTTLATTIMKEWKEEFPKGEIYVFSRTNIKNDPAFKGMKINQIIIDETLLDDPIDIETEITGNTLILFDDITTIQDKELKNSVESILADVMEVGRKLKIYVLATSHLIIPNEKKLARTLLNEAKKLVVFPQSGNVQQIRYALKTYYGFSNKQIDEFMKTDSRWLIFSKNHPQYVLSSYQAWTP